MNSFIKLPCLKSIKVSNYSLFSETLNYSLKDGMNLFVGANGLGKTTTTNLIIYGIVGFSSEISQDYFLNRGLVKPDSDNVEADDDGEEDKIEATVILEFTVGKHYFKIERFIEKDAIRELTIDKKTYSGDEYDNLDEVYESSLNEFTGIKELNDIVFILKKFLIREEEANYLIWD